LVARGAFEKYNQSDFVEDEFVTQEVLEALSREMYGKTLYDRLFKNHNQAVSKILKSLENGLKFHKTVQDIIASIEGVETTVNSKTLSRWVIKLTDAGRLVIANPALRSQWNDVIKEVEDHINTFSNNPLASKYDSQDVLKKVIDAVNSGRSNLIDDAIEMAIRSSHEMNLKRLVRTEAALSQRVANIRLGAEDPDIVGYRFTKNALHARSGIVDVCDDCADVEEGLGRGVFPKTGEVPIGLHSHCQCLLIPVVTANKREKGKYSIDQIKSKYPHIVWR